MPSGRWTRLLTHLLLSVLTRLPLRLLLAENKFMSQGSSKASLIKLSGNVKDALKAASVFLTGKQKTVLTSFLQAPFTGTYQSQSGEIVGILKNMRDTFKSNLASAR